MPLLGSICRRSRSEFNFLSAAVCKFCARPIQMKYLVSILLLLISLKVAGFGLGDWQHETPGGSFMGDPGSGTQLTICKTGQELFGIERWYFYKGFIVGEMGEQFFILDEATGENTIFDNNEKWISKIQSSGLEPVLWTRWYIDNWVDSDSLVIWYYFGFFFSIPLTLFLLYAICRVVLIERFRKASFYASFTLIVVIFVGITLFYDQYPSSI